MVLRTSMVQTYTLSPLQTTDPVFLKPWIGQLHWMSQRINFSENIELGTTFFVAGGFSYYRRCMYNIPEKKKRGRGLGKWNCQKTCGSSDFIDFKYFKNGTVRPFGRNKESHKRPMAMVSEGSSFPCLPCAPMYAICTCEFIVKINENVGFKYNIYIYNIINQVIYIYRTCILWDGLWSSSLVWFSAPFRGAGFAVQTVDLKVDFLRIWSVCPKVSGWDPYNPMTWGWDWNPKNPTKVFGFLGYSQY